MTQECYDCYCLKSDYNDKSDLRVKRYDLLFTNSPKTGNWNDLCVT